MRRALRWAGPGIAIVLLAIAVRALVRSLGDRSWRDVADAVRALPPGALAVAAALTVTSYLVLTAFDTLALHHARRPLAWRLLARVSFVAYALSLNLGVPALSASAVRLRLYVARGLSAADVGRVVAFCFATTWVGYAAVAGVVFVAGRLPLPEELDVLPLPALRALGALMLAGCAGYLVLAWRRTRPLRVRSFEMEMPSPGLAALQLAASGTQCLLAASVTFALLRTAADVTYGEVLGAFVLASIAGLVSHVPGGLGVAEAVFVASFRDRAEAPALLAALLAWRSVYYLVPLALAVGVLAADEIGRLRSPRADAAVPPGSG